MQSGHFLNNMLLNIYLACATDSTGRASCREVNSKSIRRNSIHHGCDITIALPTERDKFGVLTLLMLLRLILEPSGAEVDVWALV
jgi:hypothetical protein